MKDPTKTAQHDIIVELQGENGKLREQLRATEAKCAEMRRQIGAIKHAIENNQPIPWMSMCERMAHALSTDCGKGWHSPEEWDALEKNANFLRESVGECHQMISRNSSEFQLKPNWETTDLPPRLKRIMQDRDALDSQCQQLREALEHIARYPVHSEPMGGALDMQDIAHKALASTAPTGLVSVKELEPTIRLLKFLLPFPIEDKEDVMIQAELARLERLTKPS